MPRTLTRQIVDDHLVEGEPEPGAPIALRIDQTLTQDATGTLVMLELEALGLDRVRTEVSVQYVDHNLVQSDHRNADDHRFLRSACQRFGIWYSRPGNGVSHPLHMENFGVPGRTLLGSDSHTCSAGALGMLAMGAGGLEVALAMAGEPYRVEMPRVIGVELRGELPEWVSAKDVILELLRRRGVKGAVGAVLEYHGSGLAGLRAMDRHVIANMGAELGATGTVFPSDARVHEFLVQHGREDCFRELHAEEGAQYDDHETIVLDDLVPLVALPSSPGDVVPVREVAGQPIGQAYVGSSANPGLRDFAVVAAMVEGRSIPAGVSLDVNPTSRWILNELDARGELGALLRAGARLHQPGCNGCIGMGQAPATDTISLRTVPRNFPGRSGTREDRVHLCSPETAAASALLGEICDPRDLDRPAPVIDEPERFDTMLDLFEPPTESTGDVELEKGPGIVSLPTFDALPDRLSCRVELVVGDDVSTDEIMPAGQRALPLRSSIPDISRFVFADVDEDYVERVEGEHDDDGHVVVAGENYGQGSSREHAALAPRYLGLRAVIARSFARIHRQNLLNYGIVPLRFEDADDADGWKQGMRVEVDGLRGALEDGRVTARIDGDREIALRCDLSPREREVVCAGGLINAARAD